MRVISGIAKGSKLFFIDDKKVRPTKDRVKETLFNILEYHYKDQLRGNVLDLFAGSGALGIECLSRGSKFVLFVDNYDSSIGLINKNLSKTNFRDYENYGVFFSDSIKLSNHHINMKFSLVFVDPPYDSNLAEEAIMNLIKQNLVDKDCIFVVESSNKLTLVNLLLKSNHTMGKTVLSIYCIDKN